MPFKNLDERKRYEKLYYQNIGRRHYQENKDKWYEQSKKWDAAHRELRRERAAARRANNPEKVREINRKSYHKTTWPWHLKKRYGISQEEYNSLLAKQHGSCAICGKAPNARYRLAVDHDHETRKIRGLLCQACNTALGKFNDDISLLKIAIEYLGGALFR